MKIIYCNQKVYIDRLKDENTAYKSSKILTKFSKPKFIIRREFNSISNIEYIEYDDQPMYSEIFDTLMNRCLFSFNFSNLNHTQIFDEYKAFNQEIADRINKVADINDLVIVNDSSLFLLPSMVSCRVSIRNLKFDSGFIEKAPFYNVILENFSKCQKFFVDQFSHTSFKSYMSTAYEFKDMCYGGCWYLKPYVDKFIILDTLNRIKEFSLSEDKSIKSNEGYDDLNNYLRDVKLMDTEKTILIDINPLYLEPFIKENPNVMIRYLRLGIEIDEEFARIVQYLRKMYHCKISVADPTEYSHAVAEVFNCDVFVGTNLQEIALFLGKPVLERSFNALELSKELSELMNRKNVERHAVFGEEEYLLDFLRVNGYDMPYENECLLDSEIDETLAELGKIFKMSTSATVDEKELFEKVLEDGSRELFIKREDLEVEKNKLSYYPVLNGEKSYQDLKNKRHPVELQLIDKQKVKDIWNTSNQTILLDYDGTLTPIVDDADMAVPSEKCIEILKKLNSKGKVVVCSGRTVEKLDLWIPKEIEVFAEHGAMRRINGKWISSTSNTDLMPLCKEIMQYYAKRTKGTFIEEKKYGLVFHYRKAEDFRVDKLYTLLKRVAGEKIQLGKKIVEFKSFNKAGVVRLLEPTIVAGDDATDEDMFKDSKGVSIKVGEGISYANGYISNVEDFIDLLEFLNE